MFSVADLISAVASHLVGERELKVIFRDPVMKKADGCFYKSSSGEPIIEIKPYLDDDRVLFVMLHECAHVVLHRDDVRINDMSSKPSGSVAIGHHDVIPKNEREADELANKWLAYARRCVKREQGMSEIEALLWALLEYPVKN
jgi:Zn-dependent peptidase ImmA (M78 family)